MSTDLVSLISPAVGKLESRVTFPKLRSLMACLAHCSAAVRASCFDSSSSSCVGGGSLSNASAQVFRSIAPPGIVVGATPSVSFASFLSLASAVGDKEHVPHSFDDLSVAKGHDSISFDLLWSAKIHAHHSLGHPVRVLTKLLWYVHIAFASERVDVAD
jgi:hypothetical protein